MSTCRTISRRTRSFQPANVAVVPARVRKRFGELIAETSGRDRMWRTVEFATRGETATAGEDFIPGAGTIVFDAGQSTRTLWLLTTKDPSLEPVETTALELTLGADNEAASLGTLSNATLRILDDRAGAPDPQFAAQPFWRDFSASALALQSDGKVIASGAGSHPLVRFNADGSLDETFVPAPQAGSPSQLVIDQSGKLLIRGHSAPFARLTSDGAWDTGFFPAVGSADSMVPLANGKILVGTHVVSQLDESGKLEATWETRGHRMLLQPDGKIVVAAVVREDSADKLILRRLNLDGSIDASFAPDWEFSDFGGMTGWALLPDGRIMISGWFSAGFQSAHHRIVRIQSNGLLDDGFSSDLHLDVTALAVQSGGKVLAGTSSGSLIRLNSNGSRDATFDTGFGATRDNGPGSIRSIALQPDGKILVGGGFDAFNGVPARGLVRLQNDPASAAGLIEFDPPTYVVGEGSTSVVISIRRTVGSYGVVTVSYATQNGTAAAGGDFSPQTGVIIFGDGDAGNKKIEIPLVNDSVAEPSQLFRMGLANPVGGALLGAHALAEIQIIDNDLLKITRISHTNDLIAIDWIGGGTLENSEVVGPGAHWLTVGIGGSATIQSTGRSKFFRVRDAGL